MIGSALAADMPTKGPAATAYSWTGFYLGGNAGGGWGNRSADHVPNDISTASLFGIANPSFGGASPGTTSFKTSGVLGGVQLGYNLQLGRNWLVGAETDFDWSGIKGTGSSSSLPFGLSASSVASEQVKWFGTVRARLGYLPKQDFLTYVTGGFAYGRVERAASYVNNSGVDFGVDGPVFGINCVDGAPTCASGSSSNIASGWTAGAGFEYALWQNITVKAEYLYVSLANQSAVTERASALCCGATVLSSINANFSNRTTFSVARVGLNYRF
jgi:outer membrane immunogenic protein